ncbi:hypothetical protein COCSADRAFT_167318 [Bipolaris sorokiniana ND90Pr]|uniref:Uncharacterized protein n=1 Tax=Cochliobolus sativus (strain ND90Pr / ATCC 201652) TaxID=665912 RepID=M2T0H3_COCSN|nr:uncharacterized protein COCSADRAFT_167318 [Bipolaris sorokiniana ND90Pr]EMD68050.1 hypothetical protein COCSADRAFT_167318 [Bipolaris sorokiniana ND90Pr]
MAGKLPLPSTQETGSRMSPALNFATLAKAIGRVTQVLQHLWTAIETLIIRIATLPYYRLYHFNTINPLCNLASLTSSPTPDTKKLFSTLSSWRTRKLSELQFTTISCTVLAAAVIGAFSWPTVSTAHWLTPGFWHTSLILSILGILLSASEITVLNLLGPVRYAASSSPSLLPPTSQCPPSSTPSNGGGVYDAAIQRYMPLLLSPVTVKEDAGSGGAKQRYVPRRKMVFIWQAPLMFMSYSVCAFLAGLTVLVGLPVLRGEKKGAWGDEGWNIAVMYLTTFGAGLVAFVYCSFWVYHYVHVEHDGVEREEHRAMGPWGAFPAGYD